MDVLLAINNAEAERWLQQQPAVRVVGTANTGREAVQLLRQCNPEAVVCARASANAGGLADLVQLLAWLRSRKGAFRVVAVVGPLDREGAVLATQAEAAGAKVISCSEGEQVTADALVEALRG